LKVAFDEHIPPALTRALQALADADDLEDVEFCSARKYAPTKKPDTDIPWIEAFAADGGTVLISGERQMRSIPEVQAGIRETGVISFYAPPSWNRFDMARRVAFILAWWERIVEKAKDSKPGDAWIIPLGWGTGEFRRVKVETKEP
jgi:hypothetical protein